MNNPVAAIVRSAEPLKLHLGAVPDKFKHRMTAKKDPAKVDLVNDMLLEKVKKGVE